MREHPAFVRRARRGPARPAGPASGFTIVEVLVALGILLFGMTAVIGMLTFGSALSRTALLRTSAAAAAQAVVADLEETFFPTLEGAAPSDAGAGEPVDVVDRAVPAMPGVTYTARATANPRNPLEYRVDVEMTWSSSGVRRAMRFTTILAREIPFGERLRRRFVERASGAVEEPAAPIPPPR